MGKVQFSIAIMMALLFVTTVQADPPILVEPTTGKYLGNLSGNQFDPDSVNNRFGRYGSEFSPDSINNRFGRYGSQFSPDSVNNQFATGAPVILHHYDNSSIRSSIDRNSIRNRIIEGELFHARQERQLARSYEYLRDSYQLEPTDWSKYFRPNSKPLTRDDWEHLKKKFPATSSDRDLTKQTEEQVRASYLDPSGKHFEEAKLILEEYKKRNPGAFKDPISPPDLSKAPKWADIVAKPEFSRLSDEEKIEAKIIYFNHWIAPHTSQQQAASLLRQFLFNKP